MSTALTNPNIVSANNDTKPSNVSPPSGSDGTYTWTPVGQKDNATTSIITFSVTGVASSPTTASNTVRASCQVKAATTNYVQCTATFGGASDRNNWTINAGSGATVRFVKGNGGGSGHK